MRSIKQALVTGGNRGIGFGTCRYLARHGYRVLLTSRDADKGREKSEELRREGLPVEYAQLDLNDFQSIESLHHHILEKWGHLEVLINNAAILLDREQTAPVHAMRADDPQFNQRLENLTKTLQTNVIGAYALCDRFAPLMYRQGYGRIVNVSSGLGQLSSPHSEYGAYSISKTALNAVTCQFATQYKGSGVLINSVCPGWVKTDMGGPSATRSIEEGVQSVVWAAMLPDDGPTGGFFRDGKPIAW